MLRKRRGKSSRFVSRSAIYSAALHLSLLLFFMLSMCMPKNTPNILMDIEIAGEGELMDTIEKHGQSFHADLQPEPLPVDSNKNKVISDAMFDSLPQNQDVYNQPASSKSDVEENIGEKLINLTELSQLAEKQQKESQDISEESVPKDENTMVGEEEKTAKTKEEAVPKKKKKSERKAILEVVSKAEKAKRRKRLQEMANKESMRSKSDNEFDKMLKDSISDLGKGTSAATNSTGGSGGGKGRQGGGAGSFGAGDNLSESDYNMIHAQIKPHWVVPSGVKDADNLVIGIKIKLKDNGEVIASELKIIDEERYATDRIFRAAADGAKRAVLDASPLSVPRDKMNLLKDGVTFIFNVGKAIGRR